MDNPEVQRINVGTRGCMDGRGILIRLRINADNSLEIISDRQTSESVVEAKLPGADLGFIAILQDEKVMAGKKMGDQEAFAFVTETLLDMGLEPQFHVDDHHGEIEVPETEEELRQLFAKLDLGCGFAGIVWGDRAGEIISLAKEHGWVMEILTQGHHEDGAEVVKRKGFAVNNSVALANHRGVFSFNEEEIREILEVMEDKLGRLGFADRGMKWFLSIFAEIAGKISKGKITEVSELN